MSDPLPVVLSTERLSLNYGSLRAVDNLNIEVRKGEIYGFLGRNGAGKTSTIRMLMGIAKPNSGTLTLLGNSRSRLRLRDKQQIGYVSQNQYFYQWMSCRRLGKFVGGFFPSWDTSEFLRLLEVLDVPFDRRVSHLSEGMRVKLALALAMAHRPSILILDEPTAGLDPVARREFLDMIGGQARTYQRTTFFSSHLIDEVERVADRVGILHKGKLQYEGDIETLQQSVREVAEHALPAPDDDASETSEGSEKPQSFRRRAEALGFRCLRRGFHDPSNLVLQAEPDVWNSTSLGPQHVVRLSLEDVFIAISTGDAQL